VTRAETAADPPWPGGAAWIGGRYCPVGDARISVLDLGVTRSDCTYDVVHVWRGRFYRLDAHLDRFAASLDRLRLDPGLDRAHIEELLHGLRVHDLHPGPARAGQP
jgi:branched-chain amino acid aminotransferase